MTSRANTAITISAALICAGIQIRFALPKLNLIYIFDQAVIQRTSQDPYRYRILIAYLNDVLARLTPNYMFSYLLLTMVFEMTALVVFLLLLRRWLSLFASDQVATLTTVFAALMLTNVMGADPVGYMWLEPTFVAAALLWLWSWANQRRPNHLIYALLIVAACLNRETGLYLVILFGVSALRFGTRRDCWWIVIYAVIGVLVVGGVRFVVGPAERYWTVERVWGINQGDWIVSLLDFGFLLGVYWWFAWRGWKSAAPFLRTLIYTLPIYLIPVLIFGIWSETRLFVPVFPLILALGVGALSVRASAQS